MTGNASVSHCRAQAAACAHVQHACCIMCREATHGEEIFAILCKKSALLPCKIIAKEEDKKKLVTDFSEQFVTRVGLLQEYFELKTSPGGKPHIKFEKKTPRNS